MRRMETAKKLSVSAPGELWRRAEEKEPDLSPSGIVQDALRRLVGEGSRPAYSTTRPDRLSADFEAEKSRFAQEAGKQFERGYRAGVEAVKEFSWDDIEGLADMRFNVKRWAHAWGMAQVDIDMATDESIPPEELERVLRHPDEWAGWLTPRATLDSHARKVQALLTALGGLVPPFGDNSPSPGRTYVQGFTKAMRDFWEEVNNENADEKSTSL